MHEEQLIKKLYYETFMEPNENRHPVQVLGEAYMKEQQKELVDLSYIRFSQGEVYFRLKDYETAIFKWDNIKNELEPWAKKNMADAYFELDLFSTAEEIYKSILTDSIILNTEVAIQLFTLYLQEGKLESAVQMIKQAVFINPDYSNVTELARMFFEEQHDWDNVLELAVNEAIRTENMQWVDTLINLVENGFTKSENPEYFSRVLLMLLNKDDDRFESLVASLWNSYKQEKLYFSWLVEFNRLFETKEFSKSRSWSELSILYQETYLYLLDGKYYIKEVTNIIPSLLTNWLKIADNSHIAFAAAAVLAWSDMFPSGINNDSVFEAENLIYKAESRKAILKDSLKLFDDIGIWSKGHGTEVSLKLKWMVGQLADLQTKNLLIAGNPGNRKTSFLHSILGEASLQTDTGNVFFTDHEAEEIYDINDLEMSNDLFEKNKDEDGNPSFGGTSLRVVKTPNIFLRENKLAIMNTPDFNGGNDESLFMADSLVFLVNEKEPFTEHDRELFMQIQKKKPDLPVHFLLLTNGDGKTENLASIIKNYFPAAKLFPFTLSNNSWGALQDLGEFLNGTVNEQLLEEERADKVLFFVRRLISELLETRVEMENNLVDSIKWNEQMSVKLNGAIHQLNDVQSENIRLVKKSFQEVKDDLRQEVIETIPRLLKECSSLINEDSDFGKIHVELNREMNNKIDIYIKQTLLPKFRDLLTGWIDSSGKEFMESQSFLDELCDGFNAMFEEERMNLDCDFKLLDDWRRDVNRMTSSVPLEKVNILNRMTPSQVLLKGAGKLLGALSQNKAMLTNKYKSFIENEDYFEIAASISNRVLLQIELFENGLERDTEMFFKNPYVLLNKIVEETNEVIENNQNLLKQLKAKPEIYQDPITLFQIRLRQYEWVMIAGKKLQYH